MQLVEEQANATDSTLGVSGHMRRGETPACRHILSLARSEETFFTYVDGIFSLSCFEKFLRFFYVRYWMRVRQQFSQ